MLVLNPESVKGMHRKIICFIVKDKIPFSVFDYLKKNEVQPSVIYVSKATELHRYPGWVQSNTLTPTQQIDPPPFYSLIPPILSSKRVFVGGLSRLKSSLSQIQSHLNISNVILLNIPNGDQIVTLLQNVVPNNLSIKHLTWKTEKEYLKTIVKVISSHNDLLLIDGSLSGESFASIAVVAWLFKEENPKAAKFSSKQVAQGKRKASDIVLPLGILEAHIRLRVPRLVIGEPFRSLIQNITPPVIAAPAVPQSTIVENPDQPANSVSFSNTVNTSTIVRNSSSIDGNKQRCGNVNKIAKMMSPPPITRDLSSTPRHASLDPVPNIVIGNISSQQGSKLNYAAPPSALKQTSITSHTVEELIKSLTPPPTSALRDDSISCSIKSNTQQNLKEKGLNPIRTASHSSYLQVYNTHEMIGLTPPPSPCLNKNYFTLNADSEAAGSFESTLNSNEQSYFNRQSKMSNVEGFLKNKDNFEEIENFDENEHSIPPLSPSQRALGMIHSLNSARSNKNFETTTDNNFTADLKILQNNSANSMTSSDNFTLKVNHSPRGGGGDIGSKQPISIANEQEVLKLALEIRQRRMNAERSYSNTSSVNDFFIPQSPSEIIKKSQMIYQFEFIIKQLRILMKSGNEITLLELFAKIADKILLHPSSDKFRSLRVFNSVTMDNALNGSGSQGLELFYIAGFETATSPLLNSSSPDSTPPSNAFIARTRSQKEKSQQNDIIVPYLVLQHSNTLVNLKIMRDIIDQHLGRCLTAQQNSIFRVNPGQFSNNTNELRLVSSTKRSFSPNISIKK